MTTIHCAYNGDLRCASRHEPSASVLETDAPTDLVATARVEKTMTATGVRKIALLEVWINLPAHLDDQARAVLREAGEGCPVRRSLEGAVPMETRWT